MGTEQSYPINAILTRREPKGDDLDELRVVGGGKQLVVTPSKGFGSNFQLSADVVRKEYESSIPDSVLLQQPTYVNPGPSPEQIFSGEAEKGDGLSRTERAVRKSEDPRTEAESSKTDTGIPSVVEVVTPVATAPVERADEPKPAASKGRTKKATSE